jgi:hypothetical protein
MGLWSKCLNWSLLASCDNHLETIHGQQIRQIEISEHNFINSAIIC